MSHHSPHPKEAVESGAILFLRENGALIFCISLFGTLFYLLTGTLFDHTLYKDYPFPYFASDQFSYLVKTEIVLDQGHYRYIPGYMTDGMGEKSLIHYGPTVIHLSTIATKLLGIEPFNAVPLIFGMVFLFLPFLFLGSLNLKWDIKLISLSFLPLVLTFNFVIGYLWGQYNSFVGTFFLLLFLLTINNEKYRRPVYIGVIFSAIAISHFPEMIFAAIYIALITLRDFLRDKTPITPAGISGFLKKNVVLLKGFLIFLAISSFYLVIFYYSNFHSMASDASGYKLTVVRPSEFSGLRVVTFSSFPAFLQALIAAGALILVFSSRGIDSDSKIVLLLVAIISNFNYIGLFPQAAYRAFQQRYFWPFTITIFAGIAASFIVSMAGRRLTTVSRHKEYIFAMAFLLFFSLALQGYRPISGPGVISKEQFAAIRFLETNASTGDVLFLYGENYGQFQILLRRLHYLVTEDQMAKNLQKGFDNSSIGLSRPAYPVYAAFNGTRIFFANPPKPEKSICDFRYYLFDRYSRYNNQLLQLNQLFLDRINRSRFSVAYSNDQAVILENNGGKACML